KEGDTPRPLDWKQAEALQRIDRDRKGKPPAGRRWYVNGQGQTLAIVPEPGDFLMGAPGHETGRRTYEIQHRRRINRSLAINRRPGNPRARLPGLPGGTSRAAPHGRQQTGPRRRPADHQRDLVRGRPVLSLAERAGGHSRGPDVLSGRGRDREVEEHDPLAPS